MNDTSNRKQVNGTSRLLRPNYSPGLMLQDDDLRQAVDYTRDLSRLLFKSLFGCGVVCGFRVTLETGHCGDQVVIQPGIALDGNGDPVELKEKRTIELGTDLDKEHWITIRRCEILCLKRDLACASDEDDSAMVATRIRDGYEIRLTCTRPDNACICARPDDKEHAPSVPAAAAKDDACYRQHYAGECSCGCGTNADDVVLARLYRNTDGVLSVDPHARRFIRPAFVTDPEPVPVPQQAAAAATTAR